MKVLPLLAPVDIAATATATSYIDLDGVNWATFLVSFGVVTSTDSTGEVVITAQASTAATSNATEGTVAGNYRLSAAVNSDSMGDITAFAAADGIAVANTDDNKTVVVDIDPAVVAATADRRWLRLVITPTAETTVCLVGVTAVLEHKYPGNSIPSST
jgi:hypothetical protein